MFAFVLHTILGPNPGILHVLGKGINTGLHPLSVLFLYFQKYNQNHNIFKGISSWSGAMVQQLRTFMFLQSIQVCYPALIWWLTNILQFQEINTLLSSSSQELLYACGNRSISRHT